jgi:hypothetical protein
MITISVGTDTYGRVKTVSGIPIVTKFAMLQFLPVYPLRSFYFTGTGPSETMGIPFLASTRFASIGGIPLASVDKMSVLMAYARSIFAALALVGALSLVPGIMYLTGERLDELALMATRGLLTSLIVGMVGGALSYAIPLTPRREKAIRRYCGELLGVSADPARVPSDLSEFLVEFVDNEPQDPGDPREQLIRQLIKARALIAQGTGADRMEAKTDELIDKLRHAEQFAD